MWTCALLAAFLSSAGSAAADTFNFTNLSPAANSHISNADWLAAGRYVTFAITPDTNYPCGSEYYWLEVNGQRLARFGVGCTASIFLPTTGIYSWRTDLYVFETGVAVNGQVTTFTVDQPVAIAPPRGAAPSLNTTPPVVRAIRSFGVRGTTARIAFTVRDDSGAAKIAIVVGQPGRILKRLTTGLVVANGTPVSVPWWIRAGLPRGQQIFCLAAVDAAGNVSNKSCSTFTIE